MANKKQRKAREKRVRQDQQGRRRSPEELSERELIKASKNKELYTDIGEDGLPMTKARNRLKRVLSGYTIWGFICIPIAACWFILSCFGYQENAFFSLLGYTDGTVNGYSQTILLRIEAVIALLGLLAMFVNSFTFSWMFGQASATWFMTLVIVLAVVYGGYFAFCLIALGLVEPMSLINLLFLLFVLYSAFRVAQERPSLG
ncbi:MAG: hypothetical protein ACOX1O_01100 [Eggerthellaceae bacterium]|jgi:hypothetical protein